MARAEKPWYPTRLLHVTGLKADTCDVRLVLTDDDRPNGPYATLSHCWGGERYVQLTRSTLGGFLTALDVKDMPRTFREAIAVCMVLHIEYLWIDSLCILQDDTSDWAHEAGLMHKVYSFSHCNLSASDAGNGTHGLFRQRDTSILDLVNFHICRRDANGVLKTKLYSVQERYLWNDSVADSIINKRGWVFQERLLAPRILHFTHDQLFWECRVHSACEKYPSGFMEYALEGADFKRSLDYNKYAAKAASHPLTPEDITICYKIWNIIVEKYTTASLTRPSDKLIAISGVAQGLVSILGDEYCVGMWRRDLEIQLLWHRGEDPTSYTRPETYRAPSWSWASLDGSIVMNARHFDSSDLKAHIEDVVPVHKTEDSTGQVRHGYLDLKGELKPLCLAPNLNWPHENNIHIVVQKSRWSTEAYMRHIDTNTGFDVSGVPSSHRLNDSWERRLFYMTVVASRDYVAALMLRVGADEDVHERIGLIELIRGVEDNDGFENGFLAGLDDSIKKTLPCLRYEDGKHTVRIV
ncbi:hypothetical protein HBH98_061620 [Parastagonospora nodorum]|nr:hypothetical protein HBI09_055640 [Parastagonospora nodorum]KAH4268146.1 hypothetical protein HBI03_055380 [Parastagonospora nodorum]KAH4278842.1 hypothetical protein HBI04_070820 [Parastagonospora nodorum]KAH4350162.1 hypothetical protein HBH98_061620 [Parastagonospora nodorum]KAH4395232.1 hypothetical protein HBH97_029440 [Parastagonospora nodorum]